MLPEVQRLLQIILITAGAITIVVSLQTDTVDSKWTCTTNSSDITYSVEKCNKTNKMILKIKVTDQYHINITKPTPPTPEATTEGKVAISNYDHYDYDYDYEDLSHHHIPFGNRKEVIPMYGGNLPEVVNSEELLTLAPSDGFLPLTPEEEQEENVRFCAEARKDDDIQIMDHYERYNPLFEEVSGVGFYRFHTQPRNWEEARRICEQEGAHLIIINSEKEVQEILKIHSRCPTILKNHFNSYTYIGVHDAHEEGVFETVFGEFLNQTGYVKWARGQPDNSHIGGENCLCMDRKGAFNDVPCLTELPFFCEHN